MLNFAAIPPEDTMSIGNQILHFDVKPYLPPEHENVDTIAWTGKDGIIERNDRLRLLETFLDLAPYIELVRGWMWAAEQSISLVQAKQVMKEFIDALYISKRQLPYNGYTAKDDDIFYNTARLVAGGSSGIVPEVNNRLALIRGQFNVRPQADSIRFMHHYSGGATQNLPAVVMGLGMGGYGYSSGNWYTMQTWSPNTGWVSNTNYKDWGSEYSAVNTGTIPDITGGTSDNVPWETAAGQINTLAYSTANDLLRGILNRSLGYLTIKANKTNAMLALTTLNEVILFDVTGGW